jgi:polysaccharide chain length determinant protein (PEP-CTERM system associated)
MDSIDIQKYINMAIKRKWCIVLPFLIAVLGGFTYLLITPKIYEAQTLLLVEQQEVPEEFVQSTVSASGDMLTTIGQKVTSRTNLENIINEYGLYESSKKLTILDAKVEYLRTKIVTSTTKDTSRRTNQTTSLTIAFRNDDPEKTMQITNALAASYKSEYLNLREEQSLGTSTLLAEELLALEDTLKKKEEELKKYKERYMGGLPEELDSNQKIFERLTTSLEQYNSNLRDAENRRNIIINNIAASNTSSPDQSLQSGNGGQVDELASLKKDLATIESRYTKNHPDVIRLRETIAALQKERAESQAQSGSAVDEASLNIAAASVDGDLKSQLQKVEIEIAKYKGNITDTESQIKWYQEKIKDTPKRELELLSITREYENLKESYSNLYDKKLEADRSLNMEKKQKGEQLRIIDFAKIPENPVEPDIKKIIMMTLALGLGLGCSLAYLVEMMDTSYKTPDEVEKEIQLPVLVSFPSVLTEIELKNIKRKSILAYTGVSVGFLLSVIGILVVVKGVPGTIDFVKGFFISV